MSAFILAGITLALLIISITAVANALLFPRLGAKPRPLPSDPPLVSVLIPARNEAAVIGDTVARLLAQDYPRFELLILDDHSQDGTAAVARAAAAGDARLRVLAGAALPGGWVGKNWACHQLAQAAQGEIFLFADADVQWRPGALAALVAEMHAHAADMLTVWPTQTTVTWGERLVVPLMALAILAYLPVVAVHHTPWPAFAAANGQCLALRRQAYEAVGGHAAVANNIVEDVALARRVKGRGLRLRMFDGAGRIGCRMYRSWPEVRDGYAKNILAGHANSVPFLLLSGLFHWLIYVLPWLWLPFDGRVWPLAAGGALVRMLTAAATRQRVWDGLLMPVSAVLMTRIAAQAIVWRYTGGPRWKGRVVN
jgi:chlorobactene glucosyltransferase